VVRGPGAARWGFFLRAETMHGVFGGIAGARDDPADFHAMSHGESFLALLATRRFADGGLYVLDEPESALSFTSCLSLVALLHDLAATGTAQVVVATHSPIIAALPGARVLVVDEDGLTETEWADVPLVAHWRNFLEDPVPLVVDQVLEPALRRVNERLVLGDVLLLDLCDLGVQRAGDRLHEAVPDVM
jgi:predicted ATPase